MIQYVYIRNILCICRYRKLEERKLAAMHHQQRRGHRWAGRRKIKGHRSSIVRKRNFQTRERGYHWTRWRKGCTHMERDEDLRYCCLSPPQIKLQGHLRRQPTVPRGTTNSLEELICTSESGEPRLCVRSTTERNSGAIESTRKNSTIESGE
jgi:hypothetical protein